MSWQMAARHQPANRRRIRQRSALGLALVASLLVSQTAGAQKVLTLETSEGDVEIEFTTHPDLQPFVDLFFSQYRPSLIGGVFHRSDKLLACTEQLCSCNSYDCTPCQDAMDPELVCDDGDLATCECEDMSTPAYMCSMTLGNVLTCPTGLPSCTCDDLSVPAFECMDGSTPPGECTDFEVTDQTIRSGALHAGLHQLQSETTVVDIADFMPASLESEPGIFENNALTLAFVRDPVTCDLTSEWIINMRDNSDVYDDVGCAGDPPVPSGAAAYLVFGIVSGSSTPLNLIAETPTANLTAELGPAVLSCSNPPSPLTSWITGVSDMPTRCPGWDEFPLFDFSLSPVPPVLGNCQPGDVTCMCPQGMQPCTERALPLCELAGDPETALDEEGNEIEVVPCLEPVCDDTQGNPLECTEPLGPNFAWIVPEPGTSCLAAVALATLAWLRRRER